MVNHLYVKLGSIGLCIVAITLGVGIGLSRRNNSSAAINAAKSTSTDSDLPWCPDETRRKLVVPGTESIYYATDNLHLRSGTGAVRRNLGLTFEESETPMKPTPKPNTPFPTGNDDFLDDPPIVNDPLIAVPGIMKGTSSPSIAPSSSAKPSAAVIPACKTKSPSPSSNIDKCVPSSRRGLGTEVTPNPTVCACPPEETRKRRKLGSEITSTLSPAPTICSSMRTEAPSPPPSPCDGTDDCPDVPEIITPPPSPGSTTPPSPSPNAVVCPPCPGDRTTSPTPLPSTKFPTREPSPDATPNPTKEPTRPPTPLPTNQPTPVPSPAPTNSPTAPPTLQPTAPPSSAPTNQPTPVPSPNPTRPPTPLPTNQPSPRPTPIPTKKPTSSPTKNPTPSPTVKPTPRPTTPVPTMEFITVDCTNDDNVDCDALVGDDPDNNCSDEVKDSCPEYCIEECISPTPVAVTMPSQAPTPIATSVLTSQGSNEGTVTVSTETTGPPTMPGREP